MFTLIGIPVNRLNQFDFDLFGASVKVGPAVGARLRGYCNHWHMRFDVLGEPVTVYAQIVMGDACAYPTSPSEFRLQTHAQ